MSISIYRNGLGVPYDVPLGTLVMVVPGAGVCEAGTPSTPANPVVQGVLFVFTGTELGPWYFNVSNNDGTYYQDYISGGYEPLGADNPAFRI